MVDDPPSASSTAPSSSSPSGASAPSYDWLRWTIRITGILLMFGGAIYLGIVASNLLLAKLSYGNPYESLFALIISLVGLGLGIFVLRTGLRMFRTVDASAIGHFAFVFALVYNLRPDANPALAGLFNHHFVLMALLLILYFGLSYWVLKRILLHLLLPRMKGNFKFILTFGTDA